MGVAQDWHMYELCFRLCQDALYKRRHYYQKYLRNYMLQPEPDIAKYAAVRLGLSKRIVQMYEISTSLEAFQLFTDMDGAKGMIDDIMQAVAVGIQGGGVAGAKSWLMAKWSA